MNRIARRLPEQPDAIAAPGLDRSLIELRSHWLDAFAMLDFDGPAFSFRTDADRKLVEIAVIGHWDMATMDRFEGQLDVFYRALERSVCRLGEQVTIFDLRGFAVQSPRILMRIAAKVKDPTIASRHVAVLISSMLLRMQARRIAPRYGIFATRDEAIEWLFTQDMAAKAS